MRVHTLLIFALAGLAASKELPHVLLLLADDLGWGNVGWHRPADGSWKEVATPAMDALVKDGIELNRAVSARTRPEFELLSRSTVHVFTPSSPSVSQYAYHMCSPTRSSLQSGRLPLHVNVVNADPTIYDADSSSGTGAGIPRNMTTIATKMRSAGYKTVMAVSLSVKLTQIIRTDPLSAPGKQTKWPGQMGCCESLSAHCPKHISWM